LIEGNGKKKRPCQFLDTSKENMAIIFMPAMWVNAALWCHSEITWQSSSMM